MNLRKLWWLPGLVLVLATVWALHRPTPPVQEGDWELDLPEGADKGTDLSAMPADAKDLVDLLASENTDEARGAWLKIGARQDRASAFLKDFGPALRDGRPVYFSMLRDRFSGGGHTFVFFTVDTPSAKGVPAPAYTVAQSLCYLFWSYEDVSNSGFRGNFQTWWSGYGPAHGLPGSRPKGSP